MNDQQNEIITVLKDLAAVMQAKGMTQAEIDRTFFDLTVQVEMATVEEILAQLPVHRRKVLEEMTAQNKTAAEIAQVVKLNRKKVDAIEMRKFKEIFEN